MQKIHLICNAHLDPVWQWEWEEGVGAALSTFRTAAELCEENEFFIFNHNEAILYQWIEEFDMELFKRIQKLVKEKKWHIIGGWYLQPDCNMPSGESFVRQILLGKQYFMDKFGICPKTAVNFDSFGHSRGLVQILKKSGYDSYVFMRPDDRELALPDQDFTWVGFDKSEITVHRIEPGYNSALGEAVTKIEKWINKYPDKQTGFIAWGIGNHGGGPSRQDVKEIAALIEKSSSNILHSTPEDYFKDIAGENHILPKFEKSLTPNQIGCYTSQAKIKHMHRLLENRIFFLEKMLCNASYYGLIDYPEKEIKEALKDLAFVQFHDILAGTSIRTAEEAALWQIGHGLHICAQLRTKAFFALYAKEKKADKGVTPIFIYNPHPYSITGVFQCEFALENQNWSGTLANPIILHNGKKLKSQLENEESNLKFLDWRKNVVFNATLEPMSMNRFNCEIEFIDKPVKREDSKIDRYISVQTKELEILINTGTGLLDKYLVNGADYLKEGAFSPVIMEDSDDSWAMAVHSFPDEVGRFSLMGDKQCKKMVGTGNPIKPVHIIEDGEVRTVVEALFAYEESYICTRYMIPKEGTEIEIYMQVSFVEPSKMLKLSVPTVFEDGNYVGETAFGIHNLEQDGTEVCADRWVAVYNKEHMVTCINDGVYGSDYKNGEFKISLLRTCAYTGHPSFDENGFDMTLPIIPTDRLSKRMDTDLREYHFWINGSSLVERTEKIGREAMIHNETPYVLSAFPDGSGEKLPPFIILDDNTIVMSACKKAEQTDKIIVRLFEPTGVDRSTIIRIPSMGIEQTLKFSGFEVKTCSINKSTKCICEVSLMEDYYE